MSICFGCGSKFGFFRREHSCNSCGRLHCSKCLAKKLVLPSSKEEQEVCSRCFDAQKNQKEKPPPTGLSTDHHVAKVPLPEAPPPYPGENNALIATASANGKGGTNKADPDAEIQERLENLRKTENQEASRESSEESINDRFSKLTGRAPVSAAKSNILTPRPKLTEQEEIAQLMESAMAEAKLEDNISDSEGEKRVGNEDIEDRLLRLKGVDPNSVKKSAPMAEDDSSDEESATAKIIKKALAEANIDEKVKADGYGHIFEQQACVTKDELGLPCVPSNPPGSAKRLPLNHVEDEDDEELPWCCICNENAILRCHGCDDDLYCRRCFREGHSKFAMDDHETSPFKAKRKT